MNEDIVSMMEGEVLNDADMSEIVGIGVGDGMEESRIIYYGEERGFRGRIDHLLSFKNVLYDRSFIYNIDIDNIKTLNTIYDNVKMENYRPKFLVMNDYYISSIVALAISFEGICVDNQRLTEALPLDIFNNIIMMCNPKILINIFNTITKDYTRFYNALINHCIPKWVKIKPYKRAPRWNSILHYFIDFSNKYHTNNKDNISLVHKIIMTIVNNMSPFLLEPNSRLIAWNSRTHTLFEPYMITTEKLTQMGSTIVDIISAKNYELLKLVINHVAFKKDDILNKKIAYNLRCHLIVHATLKKIYNKFCNLYHCCYLPYALETGDLEIVKIVFPHHCKYNGTKHHNHTDLCILNDDIMEYFNSIIDYPTLIHELIKPSNVKFRDNTDFAEDQVYSEYDSVYSEYGFSKLIQYMYRVNTDNNMTKMILKIVINIYKQYNGFKYDTSLKKMFTVHWNLFQILVSSVKDYPKPRKIPKLPISIAYLLVKSSFFTGNGVNNTKYGSHDYFRSTIDTPNYEMFKIFLNKDIVNLNGIIDYYIDTLKKYNADKTISEDLFNIGTEILSNPKTKKIIHPHQSHSITSLLNIPKLLHI